MRCTTRALSLTSLGFGLVATGALSLAVATDYWLFTMEPIVLESADMIIEPNDTAAQAPAYDGEELDASGPPAEASLPIDGNSMFPTVVISMHSGLWRMCMIHDHDGECLAIYS